MVTQTQRVFKKSAIFLALSSVLTAPTYAYAAEKEKEQESAHQGIERIQVSALRRASTVQEAPLNITALDGDVMKDQNITELADVARWVPGLTIPDQGGRGGSTIIVRGLNTNSSGPDSNGGTVSTYAGEIPLFVDMKLIDIERVEVLIGPQGTLYGAGTLGGAIRYLPNKPALDETSGSVYGDVFNVAESDDSGAEAGFVFNTPLIEDELGVRVAFNYLDEPGFVDYAYVVREGGVSLPDPDWTDQAAVDSNLKQVNDANTEEVTTARVMLRWTPNETIDSTLSYFYQKQDVGGRSIVHFDSLSATNPLSNQIGQYESAYRYEEPREKETSLLSLEVTADLGFAELTSATGFSEFDAVGQRDQTDLLIRLDFSYEEFPAFSAFTREVDSQETFTQEIRLVSTDESDLSWIVGGFYNKIETDNDSREFAPGFDQFVVDNWDGVQLRPDSLEYIQIDSTTVTEAAIFGELNYQATEKLAFTVGARLYKYDVEASSDNDLPLFNTVFEGAAPDAIELDLVDFGADDNGSLFKFNVNYQFNDDLMAYVTASEGFRIGGANTVSPCPADVDEQTSQQLCGLANELTYDADTTTNYELGFKSVWLKNKIHFNAALFFVDWDQPQVATTTEHGQLPIITNAGQAQSSGVEISSRVILSDSLKAYATYAYTKAELTEDVPELFGAKDGDRLPGSAEQQFSLGATYSTEVFDGQVLDINYGLTYQSDVYSKVGLRDDGEALPGYALSNISAKISDDAWSVALYVDNMFDKYAFSSVRRDKGDIGLSNTGDNSNGTAIQRNYGHYLVSPRTVGLRFNYMFDL